MQESTESLVTEVAIQVAGYVGAAAGLVGTLGLLTDSGGGVGPRDGRGHPGTLSAASDLQGPGSSALGVEVWTLATALGVLALGAFSRDLAVEGIGVVGLVVVSAGIVGDHLVESQGAAVAPLLVGVALVLGAVLGIRRLRPLPPPSSSAVPPPP